MRDAATGTVGHADPGNMEYAVLVNLLRMWQVVDATAYDSVVKVAGKPYGERGNTSSAGLVNLRGNLVESILRWTQQMAMTPDLCIVSRRVPGKARAGRCC